MNKTMRRFLGSHSFCLDCLCERRWLLNAVFCHKRAVNCMEFSEGLPISLELTCMFNCFSLGFLHL